MEISSCYEQTERVPTYIQERDKVQLRTNGGHPWMMSDLQYHVNLMYLLTRDVQV